MLVKFFNRGRGGGNGPANYLMGKNRDREHAQVLRGNLENTVELINGLSFARNYTSGCLSFAESDISNKQKNDIMNTFEKMIFTGLEPDQFDITWIEHKDKGRLELNFLIPNVELKSGKRYQPYYHQAENKMMNSWQQVINDLYYLKDPHNPRNKSALTLPRDLPRNKKEAHELITNGLTSMAENGLVQNRSDVIQALEKSGFEIARQAKSFISIRNPDGGRNIRLKGALYEQNFRVSTQLRARIEKAGREYDENRDGRIFKFRGIYTRGVEEKRKRNKDRYGRAGDSHQYGSEEKLKQSERRYGRARAGYQHGSRGEREQSKKRHGRAGTNQPLTSGAISKVQDSAVVGESHNRILDRNGGANEFNSSATGHNNTERDKRGRILEEKLRVTHDRVGITVNESFRAARASVRAAVYRVERETEQLEGLWSRVQADESFRAAGASLRASSERVRAAIQRATRVLEQFSDPYRTEATKAHHRAAERAREHENMPRM